MRLKSSKLPIRVLLVALVGFWPASWALAERKERLIDGWRPLHYSVKMSFDDQLSSIVSARTEITVHILKRQLTVIDLDFDGLTVDSTSVNGRGVEFKQSSGKLNVQLPRTFAEGSRITVTVTYRGQPKDGLILTKDKDGNSSALGDNWPNRVHHWIPCLDHPSAKATVNFSITAPDRNLVVANGRLENVNVGPNATRTWVFIEKARIPPYCMIIAVGQFVKVEPKEPAITPLSYYVPPSDKDFAMQGFAPANPSLKFFSQTVAPYPYEKLAMIVGATRFGGMENSGAIVFSSNLFSGRSAQPTSGRFKLPRRTVNLIAHEIAHQWFGDSVTGATWADLWLSEGFATYFAGLFIERYEGKEEFQAYLKQTAEAYLRYSRNNRTPLYDKETENLNQLLNANNYQKGAWVLHMLRSTVGDRAFFQGIRIYYQRHQDSTATTEDLRVALERASRADLRPFFKSWVYEGGHPRYELSWQWNNDKRTVSLLLKQLQPEPYFPNPVRIDIEMAGGRQRVILKPISKETSREIRLNTKPLKVHLDPDNEILKEVSQS